MGTEPNSQRVLHAARYQPDGHHSIYLLLREKDDGSFVWYEERYGPEGAEEVETDIGGPSICDATQAARERWSEQAFHTVGCGIRYQLPERDEHGCTALFHEMVDSYSHFDGVYFDEDLKHTCFVDKASAEALDLWHKLEGEDRL